MRKILVFGNPPYQEIDKGFCASAKPIYNVFIDKLLEFNVDELVFLIPAKWFGGGKGLNQFREKLQNCGHIKTLKLIKNAKDVFKCIKIHYGLCILYYQKNHQGLCEFIVGNVSRNINLNKYDVILDDLEADSILEKTYNKYKSIGEIMAGRNFFGIESNYFSLNSSLQKDDINALFCLSQRRTANYINRNNIERNLDCIDLYKVVIPANYGLNGRRVTIPKHQIFILQPNQICTETYIVVKCFKQEKDALLFQKYLQTDFVRYLFGVRKYTQSNSRFYWRFVPAIDTTQTEFTDESLAEHFKLTSQERRHIFNKVKEWS